MNVKNGVGLLDISWFSRFEVTGTNAKDWLNKVFACNLPKKGKASLAPMLSPSGKLKGDLTIFNWGDGSWWIMGSYYLRNWHMRWFSENLIPNVFIRDLGEDYCGFSISGPKSKELIRNLTDSEIEKLPFMGCGNYDIGLIRTKVGRLSVAGELGYEINCRTVSYTHLTLPTSDLV